MVKLEEHVDAIVFAAIAAVVTAGVFYMTQPAPEKPKPGPGEPTVVDLFNYRNGQVTMEHDLLHDSRNYSVLFEAPGITKNDWNGSSTIMRSDGDYYIAHRVRADYPKRGYRLQIHKASAGADLLNPNSWSKVIDIHKGDINGVNVKSIEEVCLRKFDGTVYLYMAVNIGNDWGPWLVSADTVEGLESEIKDYDTWTELFSDAVANKDTHVYRN